MDNAPQTDQHRKVLALMLCLFLGFIYVESIWKPYFEGQMKGGPEATRSEAINAAPESKTSQSTLPQGQIAASASGNASVPGQIAAPGSGLSAKDAAAGAFSYPTDSQIEKAGVLGLETSSVTARISLLGGRIVDYRLKDYLTSLEGPRESLSLIRHAEGDSLPLGVYSGGADDSRTLYQLISSTGLRGREDGRAFQFEEGGKEASFLLRGELPDGREVEKVLKFYREGYFVDVQVQLSAPAADLSRVALEWTKRVSDEETSGIDYYDVKGFTWFNGEKALSEAFKDLSTERLLLDGLRWLGIEEKYFIAVMLSKDSLVSGAALRGEQLYSARLSGSEKEASFSVYVGPKSYEILKDAGYELQRNIKFGWTGFIAAPLLLLLHWFYALFGNYGVAIVALTILVRTLLYPLNAASFKSMKAMQDLKPEIDRIREQVTDKQQQQLELMGMYKKHGVNPLGGCLPILLQMPIFIGLYSALMLAIELRHAPFALWVLDLSAPEKCMIAGFGVPVMVILFVLSMMVQQWTTPSQMDPVQKRVMMVMPIVFGFLFMNMPAGLTLYWLTNNIISIGQQKAMYKFGPTQAKKALGVTLAVAAVTFVLALLLSLTAGS